MIAEAISVRVSVARLKTTLVLVLDELILMSHTVLARDASDMFILLQILLQIGLQELFGVQLSHILHIVRTPGSLVMRWWGVRRCCYHLPLRALMLNSLGDMASRYIPSWCRLAIMHRAVSIFPTTLFMSSMTISMCIL